MLKNENELVFATYFRLLKEIDGESENMQEAQDNVELVELGEEILHMRN